MTKALSAGGSEAATEGGEARVTVGECGLEVEEGVVALCDGVEQLEQRRVLIRELRAERRCLGVGGVGKRRGQRARRQWWRAG